jgi:hypothetical protein
MINAQHLKNARGAIQTIKKNKNRAHLKKQEKWPNNKQGDRQGKKGDIF